MDSHMLASMAYGIVRREANDTALPAPALATFAAIVLTAAVPVLLFNVGQPAWDDTSFPLTLIIILSGLRFSWILGARTRHLHEMVVWLFVYYFLGVAPFLQQRIRYPGTTPNLDTGLVEQASYAALTGVVALMVGSLLASRWSSSTETQPRFAINERRTIQLAWAALALAAVYIAQIGPATLFASRSDASLARQESFGTDPTGSILRAGAAMGLLVAFVGLMHLRRMRKLEKIAYPRVLTILVFIALFSCVNPISSARYTFGTVALAALATFGAYATVRRFRIVAVSAIVGMVVVFPILDTFRRSLDARVEFESPLDSLTTGDFDAFAQIVNTIEYTTVHGITWGQQILGVVLFWVPRSAWPGKPIDTGTLLAEFKGYNFLNLSAPMWSELMINFGWVGLVIGMVALGFLFRRLDVRAEAALRISQIPPVLGCIIPFYLLIVLRGSLLQAMANLVVILVCGWFISTQTEKQSVVVGQSLSQNKPAIPHRYR